MITSADENEMWFDWLSWTKVRFDVLSGSRGSLTAAAFVAKPASPYEHADAVTAARVAYAKALADDVHAEQDDRKARAQRAQRMVHPPKPKRPARR